MVIASRSWNILLVDDDEIDIEHFRREAKRSNGTLRVWFARDGLEGLALLLADEMPQRDRVLVLDLNMPKMGGFELLRHIRRDRTLDQLPVIVLSTSRDEGDLGNARALGVTAYLLKPVTSADLLDALSQI